MEVENTEKIVGIYLFLMLLTRLSSSSWKLEYLDSRCRCIVLLVSGCVVESLTKGQWGREHPE